MHEPTWLHGKEGGVTVAGIELEATEWSGNPFEVDRHVFATFRGQGANSAVAGLESGRDVNITVKATAEDAIRAATSDLVEGNTVACVLKEPGMATGHSGDMLILSVMPPRVGTNAELEYAIRGVSVGKWVRGVREAVPASP